MALLSLAIDHTNDTKLWYQESKLYKDDGLMMIESDHNNIFLKFELYYFYI